MEVKGLPRYIEIIIIEKEDDYYGIPNVLVETIGYRSLYFKNGVPKPASNISQAIENALKMALQVYDPDSDVAPRFWSNPEWDESSPKLKDPMFF